MILFKKLTLSNFMSYGNNVTVINFDQPGTTLITGEDLDNTSHGRGTNGVGKAQPLHCKIKTPTGWTTMGDIQEGDIVSTPSGGVATVIGTYPQGNRPVYRLTFADGRETEADEEHLWQVSSHRWKQDKKSNASRIITTKELKQYVDESATKTKNKAWYHCTVPTIIPSGEHQELPIDPYMLGVLLGDGSFTSKSINITSADSSIFEKCNTVLNTYHNQMLHLYGDGTSLTQYVVNEKLRSRGNNLRDCLIQLNLMGKSSAFKFIPTIYLENSSPQQRMQLLAGLMDTDGTVGKTKNTSFGTSSKQLAKDVQYLVRSVGGKAKITERRPHFNTTTGEKKEGLLAYNISIQLPNPREMFTIQRKLDRLTLSDTTQYSKAGLRVTSVEYIGNKETKCIRIDDKEHLYITDDFIVTHNSSLVNALVYALYDKPIEDISKDNLVNNINKKNMIVTLEFVGDDSVQYKVHRERKTKAGAGGNNVYLYINGEDKTPDSVAATNEKIEQIIGMPYELFARIVVFSASHIPFLKLDTSTQRDIIEELFGLTTISIKADLLKALIKETKDKVEIRKVKIGMLEQEHERHNHQLESAKKRVDAWQEQHDSALLHLGDLDVTRTENYLEQIQCLQKEIDITKEANSSQVEELRAYLKQHSEKLRESIKEQTNGLRESCKEQTETLKRTKDEKSETLKNSIKQQMDRLVELNQLHTSAENRHNTIKSDIGRYKTQYAKCEADVKHLQDAKCPYCLQQYEDSTNKLAENEALLSELSTNISNCNNECGVLETSKSGYQTDITLLKTEIKRVEDEIKEIERAARDAIEKLEDISNNEIKDIEGKIEKEIKDIEGKIEKEIKDGTTETNTIVSKNTTEIERIRRLKTELDHNITKLEELKNAVNPFIEPLSELLEIKLDEIDYSEINKFTREIEHQDFLLKLLTKKDSFVRKTLLNKSIPYLNSRIQHYLNFLGLPHKVEFTKEMTAAISQFGRTLDFGNLSAGQRARVNFALSMAFRDVLQNLHPRINVCMLDEIIDHGLDGVGVQAAAKLIKQKARDEGLSMYIISHRDEIDSVFDHKMTIQLSGGFSQIKAS